MELKICSSTIDEIEKNKYLICVGISVAIKPMSEETVESYLNWVLDHSQGRVQILIADEIARYNNLVFSNFTIPGALSRAKRDGDKHYLFFERILSKFDSEKRSQFNIIRWNNIISPHYMAILNEVKIEFEKNEEFRNEVLSLQENYIKSRGRIATEPKKHILVNYLLEELPVLLKGIHVDGNHYSFIFHPTYQHSVVFDFVSDIQNRKKYIDLSNRIQFSNTIVVDSLFLEPAQV